LETGEICCQYSTEIAAWIMNRTTIVQRNATDILFSFAGDQLQYKSSNIAGTVANPGSGHKITWNIEEAF
jgi:hypothetical protein